MNQVIVYTNSNGGVSVCVPSLNQNINEVLEKDCPDKAIIVDSSTLPSGVDEQFFNSWVLNGTAVSVDFSKAQAQYLAEYNSASTFSAGVRGTNTLAGISNTPPDSVWIASMNIDRASIASATTTEQLVAIAFPTPTSPAYIS